MYEQSKRTAHNNTKHKTFFDELWEKDHPNEARNLEKQEAQAKASQKQSEEGSDANNLAV